MIVIYFLCSAILLLSDEIIDWIKNPNRKALALVLAAYGLFKLYRFYKTRNMETSENEQV
jgi:hypothetical protein